MEISFGVSRSGIGGEGGAGGGDFLSTPDVFAGVVFFMPPSEYLNVNDQSEMISTVYD
jgi:hypothetical protein